MEYRLGKEQLLNIMVEWNRFLKRKVHLIACGGTAMTIGILNDYDLICSKLMRGTRVDFEDCLMLFRAHREKVNITELVEYFNELLLYEVAETRLKPNMDYFIDQLKENGLYG